MYMCFHVRSSMFIVPLTSFQIVLTKIDKVPQSRLLKNFMTVLKFREEANTCFYQPFLTRLDQS